MDCRMRRSRVVTTTSTGITSAVSWDFRLRISGTTSVDRFLENYHHKIAINVAYSVVHGAIRLVALGFRDVPLQGTRLQKAAGMIREAIEQGAVGFSTGFFYFPNSYADTRELIELCKAIREAGGVYITHLRSIFPERDHRGSRVAEALEIGRRSGVPVHFPIIKPVPLKRVRPTGYRSLVQT